MELHEQPQPLTRILIGLAAALFLATGLWMIWFEMDINKIYPGMFIRVGSMLAVTCLAYPHLHLLKTKTSMVFVFVMLLMLIILAARPQLFVILMIASAILFFGNGIMRRLANSSKSVSYTHL